MKALHLAKKRARTEYSKLFTVSLGWQPRGTATLPSAIDTRTARLLPMLFLARVDGKSPVEYLTDDGDQAFVRGAAIQMIVEPPMNLGELGETYFVVARQRLD